MGMHIIPRSDKEQVINGLAEGKSYKEVMEGTSIKSKDTISRIAHDQSNAIVLKRASYLKKIKKNGADDKRRAAMWASMIYATKRTGKDAVEVPDWLARSTALKYIDKLAGFELSENIKLDFVDSTPVNTHDLSSPEVVDFNKKFKEFLSSE